MTHDRAPFEQAIARRSVLRGGLAAGGLAMLGPVLAACSSSGGSGDPSGGSMPTSFGAVSLRLPWIKNVQFAGSYLADTKGYYTAEGFSGVELIPGGPTATPQDADVATGKAMFGISSPDLTGAAIVQGAPIVIIGAQYQKNPFCILSMATTPITTPEDLYGKKIGVQATNESVWTAFTKAARIDTSTITRVPVQSDPIGLTRGEVDGWLSFVTNEPNDLGLRGFKVATMLLADHGYPLVSGTYLTTTELVKSKPDLVKAFLRAEIKGWTDNLADPARGAALAATHYGKGLGLTTAQQTLESRAENEFVLDNDTRADGLFTVTDQLVEETLATLGRGGLQLRTGELFDLSLLEELYTEDPSLLPA